MASHHNASILLPLLLTALLFISGNGVLGFRRLLENTKPEIPEFPKPEFPPLLTIPTFPKPELPPFPKEPLPFVPTLPKPEFPFVPHAPALEKPEVPKQP